MIQKKEKRLYAGDLHLKKRKMIDDKKSCTDEKLVISDKNLLKQNVIIKYPRLTVKTVSDTRFCPIMYLL